MRNISVIGNIGKQELSSPLSGSHWAQWTTSHGLQSSMAIPWYYLSFWSKKGFNLIK